MPARDRILTRGYQYHTWLAPSVKARQRQARAVAIDYFGRTAGAAPRDDDFEFRPHVRQVTPEQVRDDAAAAVAALREAGPGPVFSVGFCSGGGHSWRLAAGGLGLAGAIGFYGRPSLVEEVVDDIDAPLLLLLAGADKAAPPEAFAALTATLDRAGKPYEAHTYEGAPHSFFDRAAAEWRDASADAWRRILDFTGRHGGGDESPWA